MDNLARDYGYCIENYVKREILDGQVYMMAPSASTDHGTVDGNLYSSFRNYLRGKRCKVYTDNVDVFLSDKDMVVPDMTVVCDPGKVKLNGIHGAPDLVVEILSPGTAKRDYGYKMELYAKSGVKEYWIVSVKDRSVSIYLPVDGVFKLADVFVVYPDYELEKLSEEERANVKTEFSPFIFPDMKITLDEVFDGMLE